MMKIKKGQKTGFTGVLLTNKEYGNYKKLMEALQKFKSCNKHYNERYYSYLE